MDDFLSDIDGTGSTPSAPPTMSYDSKPAPTSGGGNNQGFNNNQSYGNKSRINMYDVETVNPLDFNNLEITKEGKTYAMYAFFGPNETKEKKDEITALFKAIARKLSDKGYVYRFNGSGDDVVINEVIEIEGLKSTIFLPFKKFNSELGDKAILVNGYEAPFRYACELIGKNQDGVLKFNGYKKGARAVAASRVQSILGKKSNNPVDFMITYNPTGLEFFEKGKTLDFSQIGQLWFYVKLCTKLNIPMFNIQNKESLDNLKNKLAEKQEKPEGEL